MQLPQIFVDFSFTLILLAVAATARAGTSASGAINFTGVVMTPTCATLATPAQTGGAPMLGTQTHPCADPPSIALATLYTESTRTLDWNQQDQLLRYMVQRDSSAGERLGSGSTLVTVTYL